MPNTTVEHDALIATDKLLARFWAKVDKLERYGVEDCCWIWTACQMNGYGNFCIKNKKNLGAHVVSWLLANDEPRIPIGHVVMHECDNRLCVNPSHLRLGTQQENSRDAVARGLSPVGERSNMAKLTTQQVIEIRRRAAAGERPKELSAEFGISDVHASRIIRRRTWRHIA